MKEGLKSEIALLHKALQNKGKWYLDGFCPEEENIQDSFSTAKENADYELSKLSVSALYGRYKRWLESDKILANSDYFEAFLSSICFDMAMASLPKEERPVFDESCSIVFRWL